MGAHRSTSRYRPDIDGLRAIAVLSVVGFHAFPSVLVGGFVGVDIFFVISGYLISEIIIGQLERGSFNFAGFYTRRIKRIFPALLLVLLAVLLLGWFTLFAGEYRQLGKHVAGGAAFLSNLVLWRESGYFDNEAATKPLLHLWSLGVEEQFYIFWPLILWQGSKRNLNLLMLTAIIAVASFGLNVAEVGGHPAAAFYSPLARFWELMLGAMLAYATLHEKHGIGLLRQDAAGPLGADGDPERVYGPSKGLRLMASCLGLLLLVLGVCLISQKDRFPGWWALLPTVGTLLVIAAGQETWVNRTVLSNRYLVWVGLISYPLYLWHWPLFSFTRIMQGDASAMTSWVIVLVSIALAWLTYETVEKPIRFGKSSSIKVPALAASMIMMFFLGLTVFAGGGFSFRGVVIHNVDMDSGADGGRPDFERPCDFITPVEAQLFTCAMDTRGQPSYAVLGDSKAGAISPGLFRTSTDGHRWIYIGSGHSRPLLAVLSDAPVYAYSNRKSTETAIDLIGGMQTVHTVVVATASRALFVLGTDSSIADLPTSPYYQTAFDGLGRAVTKLLSYGKDVVLLMDNPTLPHVEDCVGRKTGVAFIDALFIKPGNPDCHMPIRTYRALSSQYRDMLYAIAAEHPGRVRVFDATDILCDERLGLCLPAKDGRLLYGITDHISDYGSSLVGGAVNRFLNAGDAGAPGRPAEPTAH